MTNSYARDAFTYGFDFPRPRSRAERLARLDALATLLDTAFILPGTNVRFGFDAIIGLVPGIGDAITTAISLYIVHEARQLGAPLHVIMRMLANVAVDGFVGAVPVFGDAFDVMWRAATSASCANGWRGEMVRHNEFQSGNEHSERSEQFQQEPKPKSVTAVPLRRAPKGRGHWLAYLVPGPHATQVP